jgi:hypothetical protein
VQPKPQWPILLWAKQTIKHDSVQGCTVSATTALWH